MSHGQLPGRKNAADEKGRQVTVTRRRIRCGCIAYADDRQRSWLIGQVDRMLEQLEISV